LSIALMRCRWARHGLREVRGLRLMSRSAWALSAAAVFGAVICVVAATVEAAANNPRGASTATSLEWVAFSSPSDGLGLFVRTLYRDQLATRLPCVDYVRATTDGGSTFARAGATIASADCGEGEPVSYLTLDGRGDAFAYEPGLFVSHDDGSSWSAARLPGQTVAVAPLGRSIWALNETCPRDACTTTLFASANGGRSWSTAAAQPPERHGAGLGTSRPGLVGTSGPELIRASDGDAYLAQPAATPFKLTIEHYDARERTWTTTQAPCAATDNLFAISLAPDGTLWTACAGSPGTGMQLKSFDRSVDGGKTWLSVGLCTLRRCPDTYLLGGYLGGYVGGLAAVSRAAAFYVGGRSWLTGTLDRGRSWSRIAGFSGDASGSSEVSFLNGQDGWAIDDGFGGFAVLWRTTNGGQQWHKVSKPDQYCTHHCHSGPGY
jgi:photosystem II stability/assembly factor-like uncharacterized protein